MKNKKKAFTLAELLVVIAIIAILVAIAIPVFAGATEKAEIATVKANLRAAYAEATVNYMLGDAVGSGITDDKGATYVPTENSGVITVTFGGTTSGYKHVSAGATYNGQTFTGLE